MLRTVCVGVAVLALAPAARAQGDAQKDTDELRARLRVLENELKLTQAQAQDLAAAERRARQEAEAARQEALAQRERAEAARAQAEASFARAREEAQLLARRSKQLEERVAELERQAEKGRGDEAAQVKYMRAVAETFLEGVISRRSGGLSAALTKEMRQAISPKEGTPEFTAAFEAWVRGLSHEDTPYKEVRLDSEAVAPGGDEATFRGLLLVNKDYTAAVSVRVVKDRETGRYLIAFLSVRR
jgi:hypothetical protein